LSTDIVVIIIIIIITLFPLPAHMMLTGCRKEWLK
jgi:hypothetical protein